ncbi:MAG: hypothetical protein VX899_12440 [Myxococcota bacterium]|nr:hypothetical protein [Myxococcota bacterium]
MITRRHLLGGLTATLLLASPRAWAKGDKPPKLALKLAGTLTHREMPVHRDKVKLRLAAFDQGMGRTVLWEATPTISCDNGAFELIVKRPSLGVVGDSPLPDSFHLELWVLEAGPAVSDIRLVPRVQIPWSDSGVAECTLEKEGGIEGLDEGGACVLSGDGALRLELTTLQRIELT